MLIERVKTLELPDGIEPPSKDYKALVLPLNYGSILVLVCPSSQASNSALPNHLGGRTRSSVANNPITTLMVSRRDCARTKPGGYRIFPPYESGTPYGTRTR